MRFVHLWIAMCSVRLLAWVLLFVYGGRHIVSKCPTCGERVDHADAADFCSQCGAALGGEKADAGTADEPEASAAGQPEPPDDDSEDQLDSAETIRRDDDQAEAEIVAAEAVS